MADHNVKLAGYREIEFFAQTQQLIESASPPTKPAHRRSAGGPGGGRPDPPRSPDPGRGLCLRQGRHRLQMMDDQQTHAEMGLERVAAFLYRARSLRAAFFGSRRVEAAWCSSNRPRRSPGPAT